MENFKQKYDYQIKENIKIQMKKIFASLGTIDLELISKYLYYVILLMSEYFTITQSIDDFYKKITENNYQDIYSLLILLMPYFELNNASKINSLSEILFNKENLSKNDYEIKKNICKKLETSYYVDHNINDVKEYFEEMLLIINDSLSKVSLKLCPNWLNTQPVTLNEASGDEYYKKSKYYLNFTNLYKTKQLNNLPIKFWEEDKVKNTLVDKNSENKKLYIGNYTLYGTIANFLYNDIKDIKWMIYDYRIENKIYPTIVMLAESIKSSPEADVFTVPWDKLSNEIQQQSKISWTNASKSIKSNYNILRLYKPLILFYLRSIKKNKQKIKKLGLSKKCSEIIIGNIDKEENDDDDEEIENKVYVNSEIDSCIIEAISKISCEEINKYIFECVQKFRYTWYGYMCTSSTGNLLKETEYNEKFQNIFGKSCEIRKNNKIEGYLTLKIFYNYFKLLTLNNFLLTDSKESKESNFKELSKSGCWNSLTTKNKELFINKVNRIDIESWFNIKNTLRIVYGKDRDINYLHEKIIEKLKDENFIPEIVIMTLVTNGMLCHVKYNEKLTNNEFVPNIQKDQTKWKIYMSNNINIDEMSYSFLSNMELKSNSDDNRWKKFIDNRNMIMKNKTFNGLEIMKDNIWSQYFASNWIAQIQVYTHYINQRVLYITGATGSGKSTVLPLLLLYAEKSLNFNNNAKLYCSQPRIQPTKDNAERMSKSMGLPIIVEKTELDKYFDEDIQLTKEFAVNKTNKSILPINYIQYKYKDHDIEDNYYHPTLRLYTDGTLYNDIRTKYLLKEQIDPDNLYTFTEKNMCDILLVDESHEHNTYMDMILTLTKFSIYVNNSTTLGIVSATMENDEKKYRKFYSIINDNWKYPLDIRYLYKEEKINKSFLDRRIHVSPPFSGTNFTIKEITTYKLDKLDEQDINKIDSRILNILNIILAQKDDGNEEKDILIFLPGQNDITRLKKIINDNTNNDVLAIPFYKDFDKKTLDNVVKKISDKEVRNNIVNPKNIEIDIELNDKKQEVAKGTYKRFIILATNIAEASITIDTLSYVIDTGTEKIKKYDYITKEEKLVKELISLPSKTQRKGRVGRTKPGTVYYTYGSSNLRQTVAYKICIDNISEYIIKLITEEKTYLIDKTNDPYFSEIEKINDSIKNQYIYIDDNGKDIKYENNLVKNEQILTYPLIDGKYDLNTLKDVNYTFYLIHPNELDKNLPNKVELITDHYKSKNYIDSNNTLTKLGKKIVAYSEYFEFQIEISNILIDLIDNRKMFNNDNFLEKIMAFIIIKTMNIKVKQYMNGGFIKADTDFLKYLFTAKENYTILKNKKTFANKKELNDLENLIKFIDKLNKLKEMIYEIKNSFDKRNDLKYLKENNNIEKYEELEKKINDYENGKQFKKNYNQFINKIFITGPTNILNDEIFLMNEYEILCFLIVKNVPNNLYIKILGTIYYINYINRNINSIFTMECIGKKILTTIPSSYINYIIYALKTEDTVLSNIMWIPKIVLEKINNYNKNILNIVKISKIDRKYCIDKYENKFNIIYENLTEINKSLDYK
jgi:hypothetical protein